MPLTSLRLSHTLAVAAISLGLASAAEAARVTVNWTGTVTDTGGRPGFTVGELVFGDFSYESDAPIVFTEGTTRAEYATDIRASFSTLSSSILASGDRMAIFNDSVVEDQIDTRALTVVSGTAFVTFATVLFLRFNDTNGTVFSDASQGLPLAWRMSDFTFPNPYESRIEFSSGPDVRFSMTSVSSTNDLPVVPVPAALPLMLSGLAAAAWVGRRRPRAA